MEKIDIEKIRLAYNSAKKRLFFLDLEGTLIPTSSRADLLVLARAADLLKQLTSDSANDVVVVSQKPTSEVKDLFNSIPVTLVAENGGFYKSGQSEWKQVSDKPVLWRDPVAKALKTLASLYSGSTIHERHFSYVWHYGRNVANLPETERKQFQVALRTLAKQHDLIMREHDQVVELIDPSIGKDKFASFWAGSHWQYDFILAVGDDSSDEDLFTLLGRDCVTIKVGSHTGSSARFYLPSQTDVTPFLHGLSEYKSPTP